jgi:hypothetical protein
MRKAGSAWMAFFFFDLHDVKKQRRRDLLRSLLWQLSNVSAPCYHILSALYSIHDEGNREPSDAALLLCLEKMLEVPERPATYIIIDALDESPDVSGVLTEREKVLKSLQVLIDLHLPNVHICVSSRLESDIRFHLDRSQLDPDSLTPLTMSLHNESGQKDDIVKYINAVFQSDSIMHEWPEDDKKLAINILSDKADGM